MFPLPLSVFQPTGLQTELKLTQLISSNAERLFLSVGLPPFGRRQMDLCALMDGRTLIPASTSAVSLQCQRSSDGAAPGRQWRNYWPRRSRSA